MSVQRFAPEKSPFEIIYVDVTHRCQMKCANCYLPNRELPDLDAGRLRDFLSRLPLKAQIRLIGGEATLRDDLPELIAMVKAFGHHPILITNGLRLSDRDYAFSLRDAGLRFVHLSMNGFDDDRIYRVLDNQPCAERKMRALANCIDAKLSPSVSAIVMKDLNEDGVGRMLDFARAQTRPLRVNLRSQGKIGRYLKEYHTLDLNGLLDLVLSFKTAEEEVEIFERSANQIRLRLTAPRNVPRPMIVKITDWTAYERSAAPEFQWDHNRLRRGRLTQDFGVSPWFEHVLENEFGY